MLDFDSEQYILLTNLPGPQYDCLLPAKGKQSSTKSLEERALPRSFARYMAMCITDMALPRHRPVQHPEAQLMLEEFFADVPDNELSSLYAFMQTCWTQVAKGSACQVTSVSDYSEMPSVIVKNREIKTMMSMLDSLPHGHVQDISMMTEGQWKTDVAAGLTKACKQFFPVSISCIIQSFVVCSLQHGRRNFLAIRTY